MNARRVAALHLELARVHAELAQELSTAVDASAWVDQDRSPLGRRRHLELARAGKLKSSREGRLVLIRQAEIDAYLASKAVVTVDEAADEEREIARVAGMIGRNRRSRR